MTSVATNGNWVTMIMNTRAGNNGARRSQDFLPHLSILAILARFVDLLSGQLCPVDRDSAHRLPPPLFHDPPVCC